METERALVACDELPPLEPMDLLSSAWCSSAIQVLQKAPKDCSLALVEHPVMAVGDDRGDLMQLQKSDRSLVVDNSGFGATQTQWKYDDLKSWIWLQKAIHPELDYDLKKKWLPRKMAPWSGISLKKWVKERKTKRKEEARLHKAEVHAAMSVAGVAAVLAAIAEENSAPAHGSAASMRETSVASAAALVAAQCAKVAEAAGATRDQIAAAVNAAVAATDASNVITLTAAAATSLRGAAALRGRRGGGGGGGHGQNERADQAGSAPWQDDLDFDFNYARSKAALAKGDEMFVAMPDGKWKLHTVSAAANKNGKLVLRIKKMNLVMAFSNAKESVVQDVSPCAPEKPSREEDATYPIEVSTSKGKVELRADDYAVYKRWVSTVTHMLTASTAMVTGRPPHDEPPTTCRSHY